MLTSLIVFGIFAQERESRWLPGKGSAQGTDLAEMRLRALNAARADALKQAGIVIKAADLAVKSESGQTVTDFFTRFAESETRGLIIDERNVKFNHPVPIVDSTDEFNTSYRISVQMEALVAFQPGEPDPGFEVRLESDREAYAETEPVHLRVTSTRDGFLTLFSIENDSLTLLFPNALSRDDSIRANAPFRFPPTEGYDVTMQPLPGRQKSEVTFVAVVSKQRVPFAQPNETKFEGKYLKLRQAMLTSYAQWLYKIPIHERCSDAKVVQVLARKE